jgi:glutamate 5-kinase
MRKMFRSDTAAISGRQDLANAQRIVIKAGTSTVSTLEGYPSLTRIAGLVENVCICLP